MRITLLPCLLWVCIFTAAGPAAGALDTAVWPAVGAHNSASMPAASARNTAAGPAASARTKRVQVKVQSVCLRVNVHGLAEGCAHAHEYTHKRACACAPITHTCTCARACSQSQHTCTRMHVRTCTHVRRRPEPTSSPYTRSSPPSRRPWEVSACTCLCPCEWTCVPHMYGTVCTLKWGGWLWGALMQILACTWSGSAPSCPSYTLHALHTSARPWT